jgi:hypothetical protein
MGTHKSNSAFTILEFLIASGLTVAITAAAILGTNAFLDYKKNETTKPKLILEAYDILNGIEKNLENKCVSMGNLLRREQSYPLQYLTNGPIANYPSLIFFINSSAGPQLLCYSMGHLPLVFGGDATNTSPCGLFKLIRDATSSATIWQNSESMVGNQSMVDNGDDVAKSANLISEAVVLFEVRLVKFQSDGISLEYFNTDVQPIKINMGSGTLGATDINLKDLAFMEITIGTLSKSQHKKYFSLDTNNRRIFLEKNGTKLSRLLPWHI